MKTALKDLIGLSLALLGAVLLSNCVQKGNSRPGPRPALAANPQGTQAPPATINTGGQIPGTSDSGGGTGLDGKVFESYRVNPTQLKAYQEHVKPILRAIVGEPGDGNDDGFEAYFGFKTWYIAPVELDKVGKDSLGVSFFRNDTQQIARQTMKEVWISKAIFDAMTLKEQGDIIMHELVMTWYFMKFMPMEDLCKYAPPIQETTDKSDGCRPENREMFAKAMPATPARPLDDADNENIRYITGWLLDKGIKTVREDEFTRMLLAHGFDRRFFGPNDSSKPQNIKVTGKELAGAIRGAILAGRMPTHCMAQELGQSQECRVSFTATNKPHPLGGTYELQALIVSLLGANSNEKLILDLSLNPADEVELSASTSPEFGNQYLWASSDLKSSVRVGTRLYMAIFTFKYGPRGRYAGLELDSIILRPGVVVSVDLKRDPVCQLRSPKPQKFLEDSLFITTGRKDVSIAESLYLAMPPMGMCFKGNAFEN